MFPHCVRRIINPSTRHTETNAVALKTLALCCKVFSRYQFVAGVSEWWVRQRGCFCELGVLRNERWWVTGRNEGVGMERTTEEKRVAMELTDPVMRSMSIGAIFKDYGGKVNSLDFHRTDDLLVTACDDESIRLYDTANARHLKTIHSKKYGVDQICFTHHTSSVVYSSKNSWDESLRYLSLYDNRYLRYFKGHRDRVVSLCMSPKNDSFMSGSLDHTVRLWDLRTNVCQGLLRVRGRPAVAYDQQGLVFAVAMEGGAIKLFDVRSYDKGPFDTFLVGGDTAEVSGMKFSNDGKLMLLSTTSGHVYVVDAYSGRKLHGFTLEPNTDGGALEASFSPDAQFVISGSGDGSLRAWSTVTGSEVACWTNNAGVPACVKWAPRRLMFASASVALVLWIPELDKLSKPESGP